MIAINSGFRRVEPLHAPSVIAAVELAVDARIDQIADVAGVIDQVFYPA